MQLLRFRLLPLLLGAFTTTVLSKNVTSLGHIPGATSHYVEAGGHRYFYQESTPEATPLGTVLLLHGFPDFSYAWRFQAPYLASLGYRVIAPDLLGYANTDAPCDITEYTLKKMSTDMASLLDQIAPGEEIILGGHDWGAGLAYAFAAWFPDYLKGFFTISIPYTQPWLGPAREWTDMTDLVRNGTYPTMGYQLQWREIAINRNFSTKAQVRQFLTAGFGGLTPEGEGGMSATDGIHYELLPLLGNQSLVSPADFEVYVEKINQKGLKYGFNWYRTRRINWEDELPLAVKGPWKYKTPHLFLPGTGDFFMPPELYENMGQYFENETVVEIEAAHWAQWEAPDAVNKALKGWIEKL